MSFQVQPAPRMAKAPMKNSSEVPEIRAGAAAPRRRRAPPTTSTASAAATSRSAGRAGRAADRGASMPARGCRPSCRSHRRRVRPPRSSRQRVAGERVERAPPALVVGWRRGRIGRGAEAHRSGSARRPAGLRGGVADLLGDLQRLGVSGLHLLRHIGRNAALRAVAASTALIILVSAARNDAKQLAGHLRGRLALAGSLDGGACFCTSC